MPLTVVFFTVSVSSSSESYHPGDRGWEDE